MSRIKGVSDEDLRFILKSINEYFSNVSIIAFGSRVNGNPKKYSDLDLCLKGDDALNLSKWALMEEAFAESDLPILIDVSDWHLLTDVFREQISKTGVVL